ncbi:uroporphyrinogen-III synthase [Phaeovulum sp.]|uniref:uroporphyrinogen-III synthase n=1 Tax=Phaeovulum sp. TaxID=2934796 RepID=UPI0039E25A43
MPDQRPTLLLTRPKPESDRFAEEFCKRFGVGWPVVISPLMKIIALHAEIPAEAADASLVFTSANAVAPFVALSPAAGRRAYCVGDRTAQVAADMGFDAIAGPGDAERLIPLITAQATGKLIHARGRHTITNLAERLNLAGIETYEALVYDQLEQRLTGAAHKALMGPRAVIVPIFSPRTARIFVGQFDGAAQVLHFAAISAAAAQPLNTLCPARLELAPTPDAPGIWLALARLPGVGVAG